MLLFIVNSFVNTYLDSSSRALTIFENENTNINKTSTANLLANALFFKIEMPKLSFQQQGNVALNLKTIFCVKVNPLNPHLDHAHKMNVLNSSLPQTVPLLGYQILS